MTLSGTERFENRVRLRAVGIEPTTFIQCEDGCGFVWAEQCPHIWDWPGVASRASE